MEQLTVHACPLCRHECKSRDHVRSHLHEDHRKSELIDAYLRATEV
jgi:hypothetical protein